MQKRYTPFEAYFMAVVDTIITPYKNHHSQAKINIAIVFD